MREYKPLARLQKRRISPSPSKFSLQAQHVVQIEIEDDLKKTLKEINISLQILTKQNNTLPHTIPEPLLSSTEPQEDDEPSELSVNIPTEIAEPAKKYGTIVYAKDIKWNGSTKYPLLSWREDGEKVVIRYDRTPFDTNWGTIRHLLTLKFKKRTDEIIKLIGSKSSKKVTAVNCFCRCIEMDLIKLPVTPCRELEENYNSFLEEVDPYRRILPEGLTRIQGDYGKGVDC